MKKIIKYIKMYTYIIPYRIWELFQQQGLILCIPVIDTLQSIPFLMAQYHNVVIIVKNKYRLI